MKFWVCVVSREHALKGIENGFIQVCHGKKTPLMRMKSGDHVTFYCPGFTFKGTDKYQKFLGVGVINNGQAYQVNMSDDFKPFRMDVSYLDNSQNLEASILPLISGLSFIKSKQRWGYMFRFGHFEIPERDFTLIVKNMS